MSNFYAPTGGLRLILRMGLGDSYLAKTPFGTFARIKKRMPVGISF
jgi:hypothetical protein